MSAGISARPGWMTLGRFLGLLLAAIAALLIALLAGFYLSSRATIVRASQRLMEQAGRLVVERMSEHLGEAERAVAAVDGQLQAGLARTGDSDSLLAALARELLARPALNELTFTYGEASGFGAAGPEEEGAADALLLAREGRGQLAVFRAAGSLVARRVRQEGGGWVAERRPLTGGAWAREPEAPTDPTAHATFRTPARKAFLGQTLWSDLAYAEMDARLPEPQRRRVVTVQRALWSAAGRFAGVLRVELASDRIDQLAAVRVAPWEAEDPHRVFVCDAHGRLISRLGPRDTFALLDENGRADPEDGDVRVVPAGLPVAVASVLRMPLLPGLAPGQEAQSRFTMDETYLASVTAFPAGRTQGWLVGIVVPEQHYLADLQAALRTFLLAATLLLLLAAVGARLLLRVVGRDLGRLVAEASKMGRFSFTAAPAVRSPLRDVAVAMGSLEQAKTALRAMTKYVPLDLVRQLYEAHAEPRLGGEVKDVTLMFTDIQGFTSVSERVPPDALAAALGRYLEVMTGAIHGASGIIDKYIGDGVMALWNAPKPCADHPRRACEAALDCQQAAAALFRDPAWTLGAAWKTRFGLHRAEVTVGHFGAPDRLSYTAMGDGVNLAARLEGLNKQYGTYILASAAVKEGAGEGFVWRRLDRVAVVGKQEGVEVYELVGRAGEVPPSPARDRYQAALELYFAARFAEAAALLAGADDDPPSVVLLARCQELRAQPPPAGWNGVYRAREK